MGKENIYTTLAKYTELFYDDSKNYDKEVGFIVELSKKYTLQDKTALDVCCGAAPHTKRLVAQGWKVAGIDLNENMLKLARKNVPNAKFIRGDLKKFTINPSVSLIIVMFNSINYVMSYQGLRTALKNFNKHLKKGGLVVFDSFFVKGPYVPGYFSVKKVSNGAIDIARVSKSFQRGEFGIMQITHIVYEGKKKKIIEGVNRVLILDPKKVLKIMKETGFDARTYNNFEFDNRKEATFVFVGKKL